MLDPFPSSGPTGIEGCDEDSVLSKSEFLTRDEVLKRRTRRVKQMTRIYRDQYWVLMEELKLKYREYYWEYGKSPLQEEENHGTISSIGADCTTGIAEPVIYNGNLGVNGNINRCGVHGCRAKAMALTRFCHMHIQSDAMQKLYKACNFSIKSSPTGPILCGKPILRSTIPCYCFLHFQKAEKHMARALRMAGLNVSSTSKVAPKFHIVVTEYVHQIQTTRRTAQNATSENADVKKDNSP